MFILEEIGRDEDNNLLMERRNGKGARVMGINLEGKMAYSWMQIQAGATLQRSRYKEAEQWARTEYHPAEKDVPLSGRIWLFHFYLHAAQAFLRFLDGNLYGQHVGAALGGLHSRGS